jgi:hypothetical protein
LVSKCTRIRKIDYEELSVFIFEENNNKTCISVENISIIKIMVPLESVPSEFSNFGSVFDNIDYFCLIIV